MTTKNKAIKYPMDKECIALCDAMNLIPGITTIESCCGHGKEPYRIFFVVEDFEDLPDLLYWIDYCHSGVKNWDCKIITDCGRSPISFIIEGPIGDYDASYVIAKAITKEQNKLFKVYKSLGNGLSKIYGSSKQ